MIKTVWIYTAYNLYESKRHFSKKLSEAFERRGVTAPVLDIVKNVSPDTSNFPSPDLTLSFNRAVPVSPGKFFWDNNPVPHLSILVDPSLFDLNIIMSKNAIISCVDRLDCEFISMQKFKKVFFLPHAVERDLAENPQSERPYDVVLIGSCYDPDTAMSIWRETLPKHEIQAIETAAELTLSDNKTPFWKATALSLVQYGIDPSDISLRKMNQRVDYYVRGIDRLRLLRAIKNARVDVFGGTCWRDETPILGWTHYLADMPNVTVHPSISFSESLEILKKSKICLNSMPFFKSGTHERIFTGLAAGSLPITSDNLWIRENFVDGEELLIYPPKGWDIVNEQVDAMLADEAKRLHCVEKGREKVLHSHTWDNRVEQILRDIPPLMEKIAQYKKKKKKV